MQGRQVDYVIWDIGNVLIRWDPYRLYRKHFPDDASIARFLDATRLLEMNVMFDAGRPFADGLAELAARYPHYDPELQAFDSHWADTLDGAIAPSVDLLGKLRNAGVPVYAISNFSRAKFDVARDMFPFLDSFDDLVVSADVGLVKPDPAIFRLLLDRRAIEPGRAVFIDDNADNIATAGRLGLRTHHFSETSGLAADLGRLGLPV
jgi:2-haloacid dehalogenase